MRAAAPCVVRITGTCAHTAVCLSLRVCTRCQNSFLRGGFVRVGDDDDNWLGLWCKPLTEEQYSAMNEYQKVVVGVV